MRLHRELGGSALLIVHPQLLTLIEPQPDTSPNPAGAVITYNGQRIAVRETPEQVQRQIEAALTKKA